MTDQKLSRSFYALNVTQFLGALNDNVFKLLLIFALTAVLGDTPEMRTQIVATVSIVFVIPFLLFSHSAGVLADRVSKRNIIVFTKAMEVFIMLFGTVAIGMQSPNLMYATMFLMCTQSALFGPSKFGIIPEVVSDASLSRANSFLVGASYLAIIIGTFMPTFLVKTVFPSGYVPAASCCIAIAVLGLVASVGIGKTPPAGSTKKFSLLFVLEIFRTMKSINSDRHLSMAVWAAAYFLFVGAFIQQNVLLYGPIHLNLTIEESGYLFPALAIGIGLGALLAGKLSGRNIEFGIVPIGAFLLTLCCILLSVVTPSIVTFAIILFLIGIGAGLFIIPLVAFVQFKSPDQSRGEILACQNFLSFSGVAVAAGLIYLLNGVLEISPDLCFAAVGVLTALLAVASTMVLPDFLVRFVVVVLTRIVYRMQVHGTEHIPVRGGALIAPNHVTYVDALLLSATVQRRIRFVMVRRIYENKWLNPLFRLMQVIPISADDPPREVLKSLKAARAALDEGYLVCVFPEGAVTLTGNMRPFRPGIERILKGTDYPLIPAYIGGAWGSTFSYFHGNLLGAFPRVVPYPVSVTYGEPMPAGATPAEVRDRVALLAAESFDHKSSPHRNLVYAFVRTARKAWRRRAMGDSSGKELTFGKALIGSIALSKQVDRIVPNEEYVGILLPPVVGGALVNLAVSLTGRVPVNLNFTSSAESVDHAIALSDIKTIISSRAFLDKLGTFETREGTVFLEDIMPRISGGDKLLALVKALLFPASALMTYKKPKPDDVATLIFSSGSTGVPKGVMLTHHNIMSNIDAFAPIFRFASEDKILACLPLFHSFGFTVTLWCPMIMGFYSYFHPNPTDASKIAELIREEKLTILITTPTFLLAFIRRAKKEDFVSLREVVTGAEKLKVKVADAFEERFGLRPKEGYGTTELSPVVSVNVNDVVHPGGWGQVGNKHGSIGHPIPGCAAMIVDPSTKATLSLGEEGLLLIKGPNVMRGYLKDPDKTDEVLKDGWYDTGDVGKMDEDGFIFLTDRLTRFSKIGGEMVPHLGIEEKLLEALGTVNQLIAISAVPDDRKGEVIVLLYTEEAGTPESLKEIIDSANIPNLWKPRKDNLFKIEAVPTLGTGKLDLKMIKELARQFKGIE